MSDKPTMADKAVARPVPPPGPGRDAMPDIPWRLAALGGPVAAFLFLPLQEAPVPSWMILAALFFASRIPALRERLFGLADLEASLPFLGLAAVALFRLDPPGAVGGILEGAAGFILAAALGNLIPSSRRRGRWSLAALALGVLLISAFAWSLDRPLGTAAVETLLALLAATAARGRPR